LGFGFRCRVLGPRILSFTFRLSRFRVPNPGFGFRVPGIGIRSGSGLQLSNSDAGIGDSDPGIQDLGIGIRDGPEPPVHLGKVRGALHLVSGLGFGFWVLGFGFRFSVFGFRFSVFRSWVLRFEF